MATPNLPTVAIISLGSMGIGFARLLLAHSYPVLTSLQDRSPSTRARVSSLFSSTSPPSSSSSTSASSSSASSASALTLRCLDTDAELVEAADVMLSIVPPEHAHSTAVRIADAVRTSARGGGEKEGAARKAPLYLLDLNAVSPRQARETAAAVANAAGESVVFIDGGIIGGPPKPPSDPHDPKAAWQRPSIPLSGPHTLDSLPRGAELAQVLNVKHVGDEIGKASGLKMCFASMNKGLTALGIQAFTTAQRLGVREELKEHMRVFVPGLHKSVMESLVGMPPKAYRWIAEMEMIGETFRDDGGFESTLFDEVAKVYDVVANQTELGKEKTEERKRGLDVEDVAVLVAEGLDRGRKS